MRHARSEALDALEDVLSALRKYAMLKERTRGSFYHKSSGFLHFHEDPAGLFADLKLDREFQRFRVITPEERAALLACVHSELTNTKRN
jgi:hypothetical protein